MAFQWDLVYFKVEGEIFSPARQSFVKHSPVFEDMYLVGDGSSGEGKSKENPIVLEGYHPADFEALLMILYPSTTDLISGKFSLTKEQWAGVLRLSRPWEMHEIRKFAIERLSSEDFNLTPIEKVSLAREHKVSKWLVEGLTSLASGEPELSPDEVEEAIGLRASFRLVGIQNKALSKPMITSFPIDGNNATRLALPVLHCGYCVKPMITSGCACQSCNQSTDPGTVGPVYISHSTTTSMLNRTDVGLSFYFRADALLCYACHRSFMPGGIACAACNKNNAPSINLIVPLAPSRVPDFSVEALVRNVFKDEIQEYDM